MTGADLIFATVACVGFIATVLFGERALETHDPRAVAGTLFGLCVMLSSVLLLPGDF